MKDSKKPAPFKAENLKQEVAMLMLGAIRNLVAAANHMDCEGDSENFEPVTLLTCTELVSKQTPGDVYGLSSIFHEVTAMLVSVERATNGPLHAQRRGFVDAAKALCKCADSVLDSGVGYGRCQVDPLEVEYLLMPFIPTQIEELMRRIRDAELVET